MQTNKMQKLLNHSKSRFQRSVKSINSETMVQFWREPDNMTV